MSFSPISRENGALQNIDHGLCHFSRLVKLDAQQLICEQVALLTGQRFLDGHASDEAQYQALMDAGVTVAQTWGLLPRVAPAARASRGPDQRQLAPASGKRGRSSKFSDAAIQF
ncbi:hemagglutinin-related protein [Comamonas testosteroni ATCC 11996]|nr:hemagglutinin-related protein [Comamonas testosteroni ATCC 11996]